jgi:hypothetical protein
LFWIQTKSGLDHHLDHRVGWVERSETQHFVFVGFRFSTQPTFHALAEIMIKAQKAAESGTSGKGKTAFDRRESRGFQTVPLVGSV